MIHHRLWYQHTLNYSYNAFRADITDPIDLTCSENIVCNLLQAEVANLRHLRYSFMIWSNMMASEPTAPSFGQVKKLT